MDLGLYSLDWTVIGDAGARRALDTLLEMHRESLGTAFVDATTDESPLPPAAAAAFDELSALAGAQAAERVPRPSFFHRLFPHVGDDPRLAIRLDLGRESDLGVFREAALFSTGAVVFLRDDDEPEIEIYDSGQSFTFFADASVLAELDAAGVPADAVHRVD